MTNKGTRVGEIIQLIRFLVALAEDPSYIPITLNFSYHLEVILPLGHLTQFSGFYNHTQVWVHISKLAHIHILLKK